MAWSKIILSGSVDGQPLIITGILATTAKLVHTAIAGVINFDEVFVWAYNVATADRLLTVRWAATATTAGQSLRHIKQTIPAEDGLHLVIPGLPLRNGNVVRAFATANGDLGLLGYAHRVT